MRWNRKRVDQDLIKTVLKVYLLSWLAAVSPVSAQEVLIEGTVELEPVQATTSNHISGYGHRTTFAGEQSETDVEASSILIWLEDKNSGTEYESTVDTVRVLDQVNRRFEPRFIAVRAGDFVRIKNSDPVYHNVFSLSKTKRFDVGRRSPKDYEDVVFKKAGVVDVFCDLHSNMHAVIRVLPEGTVTWKQLDGSGSFRFEKIPEGEYTLHFFALGNRAESIDLNAVGKAKITLGKIRLGTRL